MPWQISLSPRMWRYRKDLTSLDVTFDYRPYLVNFAICNSLQQHAKAFAPQCHCFTGESKFQFFFAF